MTSWLPDDRNILMANSNDDLQNVVVNTKDLDKQQRPTTYETATNISHTSTSTVATKHRRMIEATNESLKNEKQELLESQTCLATVTLSSKESSLIIDGDELQASDHWAPAQVFGKQIFLPDSQLSHQSIISQEDTTPPAPIMSTCSSLEVSEPANVDVPNVDPKSGKSPPLDTTIIDDLSEASDSGAPARKDVCFGLINHPGTKEWRSIVNKLALQLHRNWSDEVYNSVLDHLGGCKFWICRDSGSKYRKDQEWRLATEEEILERTKQRFRDCRKQAAEGVGKKKRGRPPKESQAKIASPPTTTVLTESCSSPNLNKKLNKAIEACLEAIEEAQKCTVIKKPKLGEGNNGPTERSMGIGGEASLCLIQSSETVSLSHVRPKQQKEFKLAEARVHFFEFVSCLIDYEHLDKADEIDE